tara:strand:- start:221 stop:397 length:177 start_codon:yes stop_codon:yes gene_type:complete
MYCLGLLFGLAGKMNQTIGISSIEGKFLPYFSCKFDSNFTNESASVEFSSGGASLTLE